MSEDDVQKAVRDLCGQVGGLTATVRDLSITMKEGREEAIKRHEALVADVVAI